MHSSNADMASIATTVTGSVDAGQLTGTISPNQIGADSITTDMLAAGAVGTSQLADGVVTATKVALTADWAQGYSGQSITNPTPADSDHFGWSVAALGDDRVLVGAYLDDTSGSDSGAVYLFSNDGTLLLTLTNPSSSPHQGRFGSSVATVGSNRILVGADRDNTGASDAGAAFLFDTNGTLITSIFNPSPATQDYFGSSVAAVGSNRVLIGAKQDNSSGATSAGSAYLFDTNGTLLTTFPNPTPESSDFFGTSVAAVGSDLVLIGADRDNTGASGAGAAYLFSDNGTLLTTFTNPSPASFEQFGASVAAVGNDRVLIGMAHPTGQEEVYLYSTNGTLLTTFTDPNTMTSDWFGSSVAAVGTQHVPYRRRLRRLDHK